MGSCIRCGLEVEGNSTDRCSACGAEMVAPGSHGVLRPGAVPVAPGLSESVAQAPAPPPARRAPGADGPVNLYAVAAVAAAAFSFTWLTMLGGRQWAIVRIGGEYYYHQVLMYLLVIGLALYALRSGRRLRKGGNAKTRYVAYAAMAMGLLDLLLAVRRVRFF